MTGAISDDVYDLDSVIKQLLAYLEEYEPTLLHERYKLTEEERTSVDTMLEAIGASWLFGKRWRRGL